MAGAYTVGANSTITIAAGQTANAIDTVIITAVDNANNTPNRPVPVSVAVSNDNGVGNVIGTIMIIDDDGGGVVSYVDYDTNDNGYIDITSLAQLNAIRFDLNADGAIDSSATSADTTAYNAAFPNRNNVPQSNDWMGCPSGTCTGYELRNDLDFDENADREITSADTTYWNNGFGWIPIGLYNSSNPRYTGDFNGNGHTIDHLFIDLLTSRGRGIPR